VPATDGVEYTLVFMKGLGYLDRRPEGYLDLRFLQEATVEST